MLLNLMFAPLTMAHHERPSLRTWGTWGFSALASAAVCIRVAAGTEEQAAPVSWLAALAPLAGALLVRAVTVPPPPPAAQGGPDASGVGCWRLLARLELPLGLFSLVLLYWQLEVPTAARGWRAVAAPLVLLEVLGIGAGLRALGTVSRVSNPPSLRVVRASPHNPATTVDGCVRNAVGSY